MPALQAPASRSTDRGLSPLARAPRETDDAVVAHEEPVPLACEP